MTHLTLIELNPRHTRARQDMRQPHDMHRTLMRMFSFKGDDSGVRTRDSVLWRLEPGDAPTLLVQSGSRPGTNRLPDGYTSREPRTKSIDSFFASLADGELIRYRATVNPAVLVRAQGQNRLRVIPAAERPEWWQRRCPSLGIRNVDPPVIIGERPRDVRRNGNTFKLIVARVDGFGVIEDAGHLRVALRSGTGRAKAWGCGLLTVARA